MLSRFVRIQLILFTIASVIGISAMVVGYVQAPTLLGIGRITVTLELPAAGGLYQFSNVTYRGVEVGKVTEVRAVDGRRVEATLSLATLPRIPANLVAKVRSVSAVGEQYVDLQPPNDAPPYLQDGAVISLDQTSIPEPVGPMLDRLNTLVSTIPKDKLGPLLDESFKAVNGAGYDIGSLLDSSSRVIGDLDGVADQNRALVDDSVPLLDSQAQTADSLGVWARSLAGITDRVSQHDAQVRTLLQTGPDFAQEVSRLLDQVKPTLPVLLANLTSISQVFVTYNKSIQQLLVLFPPYLAGIQSVAPINNPTGKPMGDFAVSVSDPPSCTVGFLPPSEWRSPADTTEMDTPDGLYCKLPQDSPIDVRGARNFPCVEHPGKRAATVQECDSDKPFMPLATRQHVLGPYPLDPNLIAQGIPPDRRADSGATLYAPIEGTPPPPEQQPAAPADAPPPSADTPPPDILPNGDPDAPGATPSSFATNGSGAGPSVEVAQYNPQTGAYMASDGHLYRQSNLTTASAPASWTDLMAGPKT
ncbi:MAG: phospholipid/cholesterol/gamma-HCH transport system substrate-binding protein [Mycobacterium sp.]|nr:phospholipid/cholesterol/gamma-HCH transport system substrate-binding protein [Mycobacterium sp.]